MIIQNISETESGVANLRNELVMVQPLEIVEVNDIKGKYLTTTYSHIFKQVNGVIETPKKEKIEEKVPDTLPETKPEETLDLDGSEGTDLGSDSNETPIEPTETEDTLPETKPEETLDLDLDIVTENEETIESLQNKYFEKFQKQVPPNMKNNIEWIKSKLNS